MAHCIVVNGVCNVYDGKMKSEADWAADVKHMLRAQMAGRGVTYEGLTEKLAAIGVKDTSVNIRNKVARGKFTAVFFIQCLVAMGIQDIRVS